MKKVWKRLIAVSLSLMLMFTMGVNVFAEDGDDGEVLVDNTTTLGDGEYEVNWTGGTSRVTLSCEKVVVVDGEATATFTTTSGSQTHVYTGAVEDPNNSYPELYDEETGECADGVYPIIDKEFTIPVDLNEEMTLSIRTTASMSGTPSIKWTHYTYEFDLFEPAWKPTDNQDRFYGIDFETGMLCAADLGTSIAVNEDATITIHVTTKPMISNKYTKVAFSSEPITSATVEDLAFDVETFATGDTYYKDGEDVGQRQYHWSEFDLTVPVNMIGKKLYVWGYNVLKKTDDANSIYEEVEGAAKWADRKTWTVLGTPELIEDVQTAYENAEDAEVKAAFEDVLNHSFYSDTVMFDAIEAQAYTGQPLTPEIVVRAGDTVLEKDVDYTVEYAENINVGTAEAEVTGIGDYSGTIYVEFEIVPASLKDATIAAIPAATYTGSAITPAVNVTLGGAALKSEDYTVTYANNINAGTASVTVQGKGNYTGEKTASFTIDPAAQKLTMSTAKKTVKAKKLKKKAQQTSKVAVTGAMTKVTYTKVGGAKKLTINKTTGKIKVAKKTKKGTYKIKVKATAEASGNYAAAEVTKTIKVKVK